MMTNTERSPDLESIPTEMYERLYAFARREVARIGKQGTLNATALINEAWIKLASGEQEWKSREHFVASMARVMRHMLIDHLRRKGASKRGGDVLRVSVTTLEDPAVADSQVLDLLALDKALLKLRELDPRLERIAELRFFGGLSVEEVAAAIGMSTATVKREARVARSFLALELGL